MAPFGSRIGTVISPASNKIQGIRSKLDALEIPNQGLDFGSLTYPRNIDQQSGHFILFHVVETTPGSGKVEAEANLAEIGQKILPFLPSVPFVGAFVADAVQRGLNTRQARTNLTPVPNAFIQEIASRGRKRLEDTRKSLVKAGASVAELTKLRQLPIRSQTVSTIVIYMPEKITTGYAMEYQGESLRIAAAGKGIFDLTQDVLSGATTFDEAAKGDFLRALGEEFGMRFASQLVDQLGSLVGANVGARAFLEKNVRRVVNPHMQFLFRSVNQRSFEYTFQFVPQSQEESEVIDNIIRTFKFFSHPELVGTGRLHSFPAEFDIQYVSRELKDTKTSRGKRQYDFQENDWLNRIGRCYLSNMAVDYSATGVYATHRHHESAIPNTLQGETTQVRVGNPPTHITMTLTFNEIETLNRQHILEGF